MPRAAIVAISLGFLIGMSPLVYRATDDSVGDDTGLPVDRLDEAAGAAADAVAERRQIAPRVEEPRGSVGLEQAEAPRCRAPVAAGFY